MRSAILFAMSKNSSNQADIKYEKLARYLDLMFIYWDVRRKLRDEFPDKFFESNRSFAQKMLDKGLIKYKHEKQINFRTK